MGIVQSTPIPNHLLDGCLPVLKPAELKVLLVVLRQTCGWHKKEDWISTRQLIAKTGCSRRAVSAAIGSLVTQGLICVLDEHHACMNSVDDRRGKGKLFFRPTVSPAQKKQPRAQHYSPTCADTALVAGKNLHTTKETLTKETSTKGNYLEKTRRELEAMGVLPR